MPNTKRLLYVDNIRIFLIGIIIVQHLAITYGAPGNWYYKEFEITQLDPFTLTILVLFVTANLSYSMGFFYFLGGYFSAGSLERKDASSFLVQRFIRLGIPILMFVYLISPILRFLLHWILFDHPLTLTGLKNIYQSIDFGIELGPMWFIVLLLLLSITSIPVNNWIKKYLVKTEKTFPYPNRFKLFLFAIVVGLISFLVRLYYPIGYVFQPLNLQVPFLPQFFAIYIAGLAAYQGKWIEQINPEHNKFWCNLTLVLIAFMPVLFILSGGLEGDVTPALGGLYWQSLTFALWEQFFCLGMIITFLSFFKKKLFMQGKIAKEMASGSYAAFIIHTPVLVLFTITLRNISFHPLIKFFSFALPVLILCYVSGSLLRRIPGLRSVL
ncbi:MAG: acyltransferase family protein [Anaerolineales bacterium]|nr:acyltransferase family protein [Anaerolineales bacterium]